MTSWSRSFDSAMVDHDDGAGESFADRIGGPQIIAHVLIAGFAASETSVEGVDYHCDRLFDLGGYPLKNNKDVFGVIWFMKEKGTFDNDQSNYLQLLSNIISLSMSSSQNLN